MRTASGNVCGIVEEKDCTDEQRKIAECNSGIYCFSAPELLAHLGKLDRNNAQGEYYLTDMLSILNGAGSKVGSVVVDDNDECLGVNSRGQLAAASKIAAAAHQRGAHGLRRDHARPGSRVGGAGRDCGARCASFFR